MNHCRYFIRLFSAGILNWFGDNPDIPALAKCFDLAESEQSVYEVLNGEEECFAAAAHKLADPKKSPDPISILRIDRFHLTRFGIKVDDNQFGITGVPKWDRRHRNLIASTEQITELVRFLAERCYQGHDQARRIEKQLIVRSMKKICDSLPCYCPEHVKVIAQWCQGVSKGTRPTYSLELIKKEIAVIEFDDEVILPGAERISSGDQIADWHCSLNSIRRCYRDHYLPTAIRRFTIVD